MRWGDYLEETGPTEVKHILDDADLLHEQLRMSIVRLEQFDSTKPFRIGWYIEQ